jgi:hypothetical protein
MSQDQPLAWYAQRHFDTPVEHAIAALDLFALYASLRPNSPYARLLARPTANAAPTPPDKPSRHFTGNLAFGMSGPAIPLEVNLTAWSHTRSVLGVRPNGRRPPRARLNRYFAATHTLLDDFTLKIDLLIHLNGGCNPDTARRYARVLAASLATPDVARLTEPDRYSGTASPEP